MRAIGYARIIDSAQPVPGALAADLDECTAPELTVRTLPARIPPTGPEPLYRFDGTTLLFSPPGAARFECRTNDIAISPCPGADPEVITALLIATALPATVWMLGDLVLHASAVRLPGHEQAIAFACPSGGGKSTLAAALVRSGAALIADDSLRIDRSAGLPTASGLPGGWFAASGVDSGRVFCPAPRGQSLRRCPLGSIVILSEFGPPTPARIDPLAAVEQLLANRHRPRIPAVLGLEVEALRFCSFLGRSVPVYLWRREHVGTALDDHSSMALMRMLTGLGVMNERNGVATKRSLGRN